MHSSLTNEIVLAHSNNYMVGRGGYKVCKITPHHMAGVMTGKRCAELFQNPNRLASANYCIGNDGEIVCNVDEVNRAFTSSNYYNDCQAITIEVSNSSVGGNWPISDKAWESLKKLCADICRRYNFRMEYTGNSNGSLTMHKMFTSTSCPGPYLEARMGELAKQVNALLDGDTTVTPKPQSPIKIGSKVTSDSLAISIPENETTAIKVINGDECVNIPALGGYYPTRLVTKVPNSDGYNDNVLHTTKARVTVDTATVEDINYDKNIAKINGVWVILSALVLEGASDQPDQILEIGSKVVFDGNFRVEDYSKSYGSLGEAVYNSVVGGWLPCSLDPMYEDSAADGKQDNYFANTNATFNVKGTYTVSNLEQVNGDWRCLLKELNCWVRTVAVTEVQNG